jgi:hypothetical protein
MQYNVHNNTQSTLTLVDANGLTHSIISGQTLTISLTPEGVDQAVQALGAANVALISTSEYRYSELGITLVATPTDAIVIQGSNTQVVRIKRIILSGVATAQGNMGVELIRRSTAGTLGSAVLTAVVPGKVDIQDPAATAVISTVGTANIGTVGASAGVLAAGRVSFGITGTGIGGSGNQLTFDFDEDSSDPIVLRGTSDFVVVNFAGGAVPAGGLLDFTIETTESAS